jgi:hypothetical protein
MSGVGLFGVLARGFTAGAMLVVVGVALVVGRCKLVLGAVVVGLTDNVVDSGFEDVLSAGVLLGSEIGVLAMVGVSWMEMLEAVLAISWLVLGYSAAAVVFRSFGPAG